MDWSDIVKKAILVVSFGTTHEDTRKVTIDAIEEKVRENFKDYEVRRAVTSHIIIKRLKERDNIFIDTPEEALEKLVHDGYEEVIVQPLHIIPGSEYDYVKEIVESYRVKAVFKKLMLGRPVIYGNDDYGVLIEAIKHHLEGEQAVIFMGHGSEHYANACYSCLQNHLAGEGYENVFIGTVEGYPSINDVVKWVKRKKVKKAMLTPLMLVAGDHVKNDMSGDDEDSWKHILKKEGVETQVYLHGLGEEEKFQEIYIKHIKDAMNLGE